MADNRPIGVFDSGIGGLTVLREIWKRTPNESTIYFGDNGRTPYGNKSHETIIKYSLQNMRFLLSKDVKMIVIACGTASAHAYKALAECSSVPVVEVAFPGARCAVNATKNGRIGVIATKGSVESDVYGEAIQTEVNKLVASGDIKAHSDSFKVFQQPCPLFVTLAEEGWWDNEITLLTAKKYLEPLKRDGVDTLILGCTHYPLLSKIIEQVMGKDVTLIDTGKSASEVIADKLINTSTSADGTMVTKEFYTSDDEKLFENLASPFLGGGIPSGAQFTSTDRFDITKDFELLKQKGIVR